MQFHPNDLPHLILYAQMVRFMSSKLWTSGLWVFGFANLCTDIYTYTQILILLCACSFLCWQVGRQVSRKVSSWVCGSACLTLLVEAPVCSKLSARIDDLCDSLVKEASSIGKACATWLTCTYSEPAQVQDRTAESQHLRAERLGRAMHQRRS